MDKLKKLFLGNSDLYLVLIVMAILMILFLPIPPALLDVLLILNFSSALLILLLTFYTDKPLSFSTFPSLLLITTLFRLGLNISATRLILNDAEAGEVIHSVGAHVVGGNYIIGLVVFFILIIVQYVVVTTGAQRVAEVAARFTLDSLPGKQMSIDADLNMGMIDGEQATARRKVLEKETNFYGAMDGASKFVKGDAIAGIVIILIDIIGGLTIGVAQHGLSWGEALQTYTLLTVGDGIVTQIPSLIIATATGIIITRAASDAQLGVELSKQFMSHPITLYIVSFVIFSMLLMPGLPKTPVIIIGMIFLVLGIFAGRMKNKLTDDVDSDTEIVTADTKDVQGSEKDMMSILSVKPLELKMSLALSNNIEDSGLIKEQFKSFRQQFAADYGFILPEIVCSQDNGLAENHYGLYVFGSRVAKGTIVFDKNLAIDPSGQLNIVSGEKTKEPTFGLPALWIDDKQVELARKSGYTVVDPESTLLTHVTETIKSLSYELLTRKQTENIIARIEKSHQSLIEELIPTLMSYSEIQRVFQNLLKEKVSIQNLELILETLVDQAKQSKDVVFLSEKVRSRLKTQICQPLLDNNDELHVVTLEARLEQQLISDIHQEGDNVSIAMSPQVMDVLVRQITKFIENFMAMNKKPILLCNPALRYALKRMLDRVAPQLNVLAITEIPTITSVKTAGTITMSDERLT